VLCFPQLGGREGIRKRKKTGERKEEEAEENE